MSERELFLNGKIKELEIERSEGVSLERLEVINREVSFHKAELEQIEASKQQREEIIAGKQDPESPFILTVGDYTVDFRAEAASEKSYQRLRVVTQLKMQEFEQQNRFLKSSYESERQQFEMQIDSLEDLRADATQVIATLKSDYADVDSRLYDANLQISDRDSKLSAAASEIESLKSQVEELRNQVSKPTVPTNSDTAALVEQMEELRASRPAIYNVVEINGTKSTAISVDTNETIEFHPNYIGKYRVISHEEAMQFRAELEAQQADVPETAEPVASDLEVEKPTIESPTFRNPEVSDELATDGVVGDTVESESVQNHDGGESFEQAVERRLSMLEERVTGLELYGTRNVA